MMIKLLMLLAVAAVWIAYQIRQFNSTARTMDAENNAETIAYWSDDDAIQ